MAKKSLKKWIDELIDALGGAKKPTLPEIRSKLVKFSVMAQAIEEGEGIREAEAKIATLEAALEESNEKNLLLDVQVKEANYEIEQFRAEEKKREKKEVEVPEIQFKILELMPNEQGGGWVTIFEIANALNIALDETEIHLNKLRETGLAVSRYNANDASVWHRSSKGNELVYAKRLAGEKDSKKAYKHADLSQRQHDVLVIVGSDPDGVTERAIVDKTGASLSLTVHTLKLLRKAEMATDGGEPRAVFGDDGALWWTLEKGEEYLAERELL